MLLVLASRHDTAARALVERWRGAGDQAALVTAADLAARGWTLDASERTAAVGGRLVRADEVEAVISRLGVIDEDEAAFFDEHDRAYGAAELQAFLGAWLAELGCPIMNQPGATRLDGPGWSRAWWTRAAQTAGLPVTTVQLRAAAGQPAGAPTEAPAADLVTLHVVGSQCFGDADAATKKAADALAVAAGMDLLRVRLERDRKGLLRFHDADALIDVADPAIADAVRERCRK